MRVSRSTTRWRDGAKSRAAPPSAPTAVARRRPLGVWLALSSDCAGSSGWLVRQAHRTSPARAIVDRAAARRTGDDRAGDLGWSRARLRDRPQRRDVAAVSGALDVFAVAGGWQRWSETFVLFAGRPGSRLLRGWEAATGAGGWRGAGRYRIRTGGLGRRRSHVYAQPGRRAVAGTGRRRCPRAVDETRRRDRRLHARVSAASTWHRGPAVRVFTSSTSRRRPAVSADSISASLSSGAAGHSSQLVRGAEAPRADEVTRSPRIRTPPRIGDDRSEEFEGRRSRCRMSPILGGQIQMGHVGSTGRRLMRGGVSQ